MQGWISDQRDPRMPAMMFIPPEIKKAAATVERTRAR
jgi:hypothetical protein